VPVAARRADDGLDHGALRNEVAMNLNGTGVTTRVTGLNGPQGVAVNASHIY
jgi:hypothetical protein